MTTVRCFGLRTSTLHYSVPSQIRAYIEHCECKINTSPDTESLPLVMSDQSVSMPSKPACCCFRAFRSIGPD